MQAPSIPRVIQLTLAVGLIVAISIYWRFNEVGQNLINIVACLVLMGGLDNLVIYYRCYREKSSFEHEGTFAIFCLFMLGIIFQNFNKSYGSAIWVNQVCRYMVIVFLCLNFSYYVGVLIILIMYLVRQIYRLMTETLLSANSNLDRENLNRFLAQNKASFESISRRYPRVNNSCSICLLEFENDDNDCILLPSCQHCFHFQCITEWLNTKSTCPYCRHNVQLDLLLNNAN